MQYQMLHSQDKRVNRPRHTFQKITHSHNGNVNPCDARLPSQTKPSQLPCMQKVPRGILRFGKKRSDSGHKILAVENKTAKLSSPCVQLSLRHPRKQGQALQGLIKSLATKSEPRQEPFNVWASRLCNSPSGGRSAAQLWNYGEYNLM